LIERQIGRITLIKHMVSERTNTKYAVIGLLFVATLSTTADGASKRINKLPPMYDHLEPTDIRLIPYDPGRTERIYSLDGKPSKWGSILTGPYWTGVFSDQETSEVVFELTDSKVETLGNWTTQFQYSVEGTFHCEGTSLTVTEEYRRTSTRKPPVAFGVVVNDALIDLVKKGKTFARECAEPKSETIPIPERDKYADLERLKKLLDDGALTQEEFDREKAKILSE